MCYTRNLRACLGVFLFLSTVCPAQLPEVPDEAIEALGVTAGTATRNGFVFIEGRYISPPYTVSRKGNGLFINRIQVEQPILWSAEMLNPSASTPVKKVESPKKHEEAKVSPFAPQPVTEAPVVEAAPPPEPVSEAPAQVGKTLDALFDEPATNAASAVAHPADGKVKKEAPVVLTAKQKEELRQKLDLMRRRFELGLNQGEIFFFNQKNGRVNGTYGTAKALFAVLPEALRYSQSPQDLMARLQAGGVSFLDTNTCADLYRNKLNFMVLSDRRKLIELNEASKLQRLK